MLISIDTWFGGVPPIRIELGHPWEPADGKYLDIDTAPTSALLFYLNPDVVAGMIADQIAELVSSARRSLREDIVTAITMSVIMQVAAEIDRRLPYNLPA